MGTRNLTCVIKGGEFLVAQYGQWDGYPSGSGIDILTWLSDSSADFDRLGAAAEKAIRVEGNKEDGLVIPVADFDKYPSFTRDMGSTVLEYLVSTDQPIVKLDKEFAYDSLMCEWVYVVDLDSMNFDVYEGFNTTPLDECELFYTDGDEGREGYYPVRLVKSYPLNFLPDKDEFLADLEPPEEE